MSYEQFAAVENNPMRFCISLAHI